MTGVTKTKANRAGLVFKLGDKVLVHGRLLATVKSLHKGGTRVGLDGCTVKFAAVGALTAA